MSNEMDAVCAASTPLPKPSAEESIGNAAAEATAEEFIDNVASKSSLTGKPYMIVWPDGTQATAADWLHVELKKYRQVGKKPN